MPLFRSYKNISQKVSPLWKISHPISLAIIISHGTASPDTCGEHIPNGSIRKNKGKKSGEVGQMATRKATTGSAIPVYAQNIQGVEQNMKLESERIILMYYKGSGCIQ